MSQVPVVRTVCSAQDFARAFIRAWRRLFGDYPSKDQCGVLYAQWIVETSGRECWNWNIGNVKVTQAQIDAGVDWMALAGVFEDIDGKRVVFPVTSTASRFRAYATLDVAMRDHLDFLRQRFPGCWPSVEHGDPGAFAHALKAGRDGKEGTADDYFTAPAEAYARIMGAAHARFLSSPAFDDALAALRQVDEEPTQPPFDVVHALPDTVGDPEGGSS